MLKAPAIVALVAVIACVPVYAQDAADKGKSGAPTPT